jgi:hypothetical protein
MAFDAERGLVVLFGGRMYSNDGTWLETVFGDTWEYDGTSWRKVTPKDPEGDGNPMKGYGQRMVYDEDRKVIVMIGGQYVPASGDPCENGAAPDAGSGYCIEKNAWQWNGTSWRKIIATDPEGDGDPPFRRYASLTYDQQRRRVVLYAGYDPSKACTGGKDTSCRDLWQYDGTSWWRPATFVESPSTSWMLYWDPFTAHLSDGTTKNYLDWAEREHPAHLYHVPLVFSGLGDVAPVRVGVSWTAGGSGYDNGSARQGVDLLAWNAGRWRKVAAGNAAPGAPGAVAWATIDADTIAGLFHGAQKTATFAVAPAWTNGALGATIATDYVEVTITYRRK